MKTIQRTFIPGDKWVYLKIYTGPAMSDWIIADKLYPLIKKMIQNKIIEIFFFIRYYDPDYHIRIRLLLSNNTNFQDVIEIVRNTFKSIIDKQYVWKIQLDTYEREIERYNPFLIEEVESLYFVDSIFILQLLRQINKIQDEKYRWMIALLMNEKLLSDFDFTMEQKRDLMIFLSEALKDEFGFDKFNSKQFNTKYRENKLMIESVLNNQYMDSNYKKLTKLVGGRSAKMKPIIHNIQRISTSKRLNIQNYIGSYIHMTMNRLFMKDNKVYELVIYDFMKRYYTSKIVITNKSNN